MVPRTFCECWWPSWPDHAQHCRIHAGKGQDELNRSCDLNCCLRIQHIAELWDMTRSRLAGLANPSGFRLRHGHIVRMAIKGEEPVISDNYHKSGTGTLSAEWRLKRLQQPVTHHCHTCMLSNMTLQVA